jgi:hypothetical protein
MEALEIELGKVVHSSASCNKRFDILIMHHCLYTPKHIKRSKFVVMPTMKVQNEFKMQEKFNTCNLGRLLLGGHIHWLFPKHGKFPESAVDDTHGQIGHHNLQLTVGPVMLPHGNIANEDGINTVQQQFQRLTFYRDSNDSRNIGFYIGRTLYCRSSKHAGIEGKTIADGYLPVPIDESGNVEELVYFLT